MLSRPFESHLTLRNKNKGTLNKMPLRLLAEAEGFEPPWAFTQTVFKFFQINSTND